MRRSVLVASELLLLLCLAESLAAQAGDLQPGTRIRITLRGVATKPLVGIVDTVRADTIVLRTASERAPAFALADVARVEQFAGKKRPMWAKLAPLWGAAVGFGLGALAGHDLANDEGTTSEPGELERAWGTLFAVPGLIGGIRLAVRTKTDVWQPVPHEARRANALGVPSVSITPTSRGLSVGLRTVF
jgi:hypothetical protein